MGQGAVIPPGSGALTTERSICLPGDIEWVGMITGLLDRMRKPYFWDASTGDVDSAVETANAIFYAWLDQLCASGVSMEYRIKPLSPPDYIVDLYILQTRVTGGDWVDTGYNLSGMGKYHAVFSAVKDTDGNPIGDSTWDESTSGSSDGVTQSLVTLVLDKAALGAGTPGLDGKSISFDEPPSVEVDPNQPAQIRITGDTDTEQIVQADLPRSREFFVGDVIPIAPGGAPTVEFHERSETGDIDVDFGLVTGATGGAGSGIEIDETPLADGEIREIDALVPPLGYIVPIRLKANDVITVPEQAKGLWASKNEFASGDYVSDENGTTVGIVTDVGRLMHVIKRPASSVFGDEAFYSDVLTIDTDDTMVMFRQAKRAGFLPDGGYLKLRYQIFRPNLDFHIIGLHDFRPNDGGWHVVEEEESSDVNYGGFYDPGDGTNGGFKPTYNSAAGMFSLSIAPPIGAPLVSIDSVRMYWENADGHFAWVVKTRWGGGWSYSSVHNLSGSFGDDLITASAAADRLVIHCNSYGQDGTTWRLYQLQITGSET